ncbi:alternative ribosome-rescue factor A [Metapseudomonas resinovorans]|nr:alternative ribosome-rescue factor A [Pseudomonas resinovorans]
MRALALCGPHRGSDMAKKRKPGAPNRAKTLVAQPLFRCRQEKPMKGKGSYRREASHDWEASSLIAV